MFVRATELKFLNGVKVEVTYIDGSVIKYDFSTMFSKYPQLKQLKDRKLFESGRLDPGGYGIIWNDQLDFDVQSIYECGKKVGTVKTTLAQQLGYKLLVARENAGITQQELAKITGIDQADISKLERGYGNPSVQKIEKLLMGLNKEIKISID